MKNKLILGLAVLVLCGCSKKDSLNQELRDDAMNLSGSYETNVSEGSEVAMKMSIGNETGKHDIVIKIMRSGGYSQRERDFYQTRHGFSLDQLHPVVGDSFDLGRGFSETQKGGENISDDRGRSSRFIVCSQGFRYDQTRVVTYCAHGVMRKDDPILRGRLETTIATTTTTHSSAGSKDIVGKDFFELKFVAREIGK